MPHTIFRLPKLLGRTVINKALKNFSYLAIGNVLSQVFSFFSIIKVTQVLAPTEYGTFSFLSTQGLLLLSISSLGTKNIIVRTIARDPMRTRDLVINGIILKSIALTLISFIYIIYNYLFGRLTLEQFALVFIFTLFNIFFDALQYAFFGREKMFVPSIINLFYSLTWFLSVYLLPKSIFTSTNLFSIVLILNSIKVLLTFLCLHRQRILLGEILQFRIASARLLRESWPYFFLIILMLPITSLSNNFLDIFSTTKEIGYFNLSQKLIGPISLVLDLGLVAIFPNLSALWVKDKDKFYNFISNSFKYFVVFSLLLCFFFTLFAKEIITLLFSEKYLPAVKVSQLQIWYLFLASIDSLIGTILGATNKEKLILKCAIIKAMLCTPVLLWGSKYGALGLSYGYVFSVAIYQIYLWNRFVNALNITIKNSNPLWILSLAVFLFSYFIVEQQMLLYKIIIAFFILGVVSYYLIASIKLK